MYINARAVVFFSWYMCASFCRDAYRPTPCITSRDPPGKNNRKKRMEEQIQSTLVI